MEVEIRGRGRITIPASIGKALSLKKGDMLQILTRGREIILRPRRVVKASEIEVIIGPAEIELAS